MFKSFLKTAKNAHLGEIQLFRTKASFKLLCIQQEVLDLSANAFGCLKCVLVYGRTYPFFAIMKIISCFRGLNAKKKSKLLLIFHESVNRVVQLVSLVLEFQFDFALDLLHGHVYELFYLLAVFYVLGALGSLGSFTRLQMKKNVKNVKIKSSKSNPNIFSTRRHCSPSSFCT
jgi:hypothetical protein